MTKMNDLFNSNPSNIVTSDRVLYTPSLFARSSLLHLQEIGSLQALKPHISSRANLQSYLFFIVTSGSGELIYNNTAYTLSVGDCVFIDCMKPYSHQPDERDLWSLSWCHFYGPMLTAIYNKYCERGGRPVFTPSSSKLSSSDVSLDAEDGRRGEEGVYHIQLVLTNLLTTARSSDYVRDMKINSLLSELMLYIMAESWHPEDKKPAPKRSNVVEVKRYLDEHYTETMSLEELSNRFFMDKYYLAKSFKSQFGLNISTYIQNIRITKAKQMLRFSDKTVEEIGCEVGMDNPAYFSRVFKNIEGVSPKMYREQW